MTNKRREGYLMVEVFVAICISLIVMSTVNLMLKESVSLIEQTDSRIELMEQFNEMKGTIKREIRNAYKLEFLKDSKPINLDNEFKEVDRIEIYRVDDVKGDTVKTKKKRMYVNKWNKKMFIYYNGGSYEIGNYADSMEIKQESENSYSIKLKLNKNNNHFNDIINIRMRN